jgi:glucose/arabinose dehydrogenase
MNIRNLFASAAVLGAVTISMSASQAQQVPTLLDPTLKLETLVNSGINVATSMVFVNSTDFIVTTKSLGKITLFTKTGQTPADLTPVDLTFDIPANTWTGVAAGNYSNLAVNSTGERGLLCVQLHPDFATNKYVYTYATESSTGANVSAASATVAQKTSVVPLGNRVDRWVYDAANKKLVFDMNIIKLQALQPQDDPTLTTAASHRDNHNGGIIRFEKKVTGQSAKMFIIIGDNGRRGMMQNLQYGPTTGTTRIADVGNFGPEPDNRALTGVVIRLNDDGTIPTDNPFYNHNLTFSSQTDTGLQNEAVANLKRVYAYGIRNSFGLAIDPFTGKLWESENGDDAMDEINVIGSGFNGGWVQFMGPKSRIGQFRDIENPTTGSLGGQNRYPVSNIATTTAIGESRLVNIPGATYTDPVFSWKYCIAPNAIGFVNGNGLGAKYNGNLIVGSARGNNGNTAGVNAYGVLYRFVPNATRTGLQFADRLLTDKVADNTAKGGVTEQKSVILGTGFNIVTDIVTAPDGSLYILGMTTGTVGNVFRISLKTP